MTPEMLSHHDFLPHLDSDGDTSNVTTNGIGIIKKQYANVISSLSNKLGENYLNEHYFREKEALQTLKNEKFTPNLISFDDEKLTLYLSDCGEKLDGNSAPVDWKKQLQSIIYSLKKYDLYHNDMYLCNFCVNDEVIYLIDFGWCSTAPIGPKINLSLKGVNEFFNTHSRVKNW